jgi:hypothetical protein
VGGLARDVLSPEKTRPELILMNPVMQFTTVVLPDPLGPMIPSTSPSFTSKLTRLRARIPPKALVASSIRRMGSPLIP